MSAQPFKTNFETLKSRTSRGDNKFLIQIPGKPSTGLKILSKYKVNTEQSLSKLGSKLNLLNNSVSTCRNSSSNQPKKKQLLNTTVAFTSDIFSPRKSTNILKINKYRFKKQMVTEEDEANDKQYCLVTLTDYIDGQAVKKHLKIKVNTTSEFKDLLLNQSSEQTNGFTAKPSNCLLDVFLTLENCDLSFLNGTKLRLKSIKKQGFSKVNLSSFQICKCIGSGGFSKVFLCRFKEDGQFYAMKVIDKHFIVKHNKANIVLNERNVMEALHHPFIVEMKFSFETADSLIFILEYCPGGQMFSLIKRYKRMPEEVARFYMIEILLALEQVHKEGVLYRDFKPENILLDQKGHIKIADFGLAKPNYFSSKDRAYSFCGSPQYMPPEMILKQGHSLSVDFYCLGAVLYEFVTGLPPFYSKDPHQIYNCTVNEEIDFPSKTPLSTEIKDLLKGLLCKDQNYRTGSMFGVKEVLAHPWFGKFSRESYLNRNVKPPTNFLSISSIILESEDIKQKGTEFLEQIRKQQQESNSAQAVQQVEKFYYDYRYSCEELDRIHTESTKAQSSIFKKKLKKQNFFKCKKTTRDSIRKSTNTRNRKSSDRQLNVKKSNRLKTRESDSGARRTIKFIEHLLA